MQVYWSEAFLEPHLPAAASQAAHLTRDFWRSVLFAGQAASLPRETVNIVLGLSLIGMISLGRRSVPTVVMLFAPAVLAGVASLLKAWPLTPRLLLFGAPAVLITLPAGLAAVSRLVPARARIPVQMVLTVALIAAASLGVGRPTGMDRRFIGVPEALREVATRAGAGAAVYLSPGMGPSCTYYLGWHPDRAGLEGEVGTPTCALRGRRTLVGRWPLFVGLAPGEATSAAKTVRPEWLQEEVRRIRQLSNTETWLLIGDVDLKTALPGALEQSGAIKLADSETRGVRILKYRP
jgi:hypothetical protein